MIAASASGATASQKKRGRNIPLGKLVRTQRRNFRVQDEEKDALDAFELDDGFDPDFEQPLWPKTKNKRYFIYLLLSEPLSSKVSQWISVFILFAIMFSVLMFVLETLPRYRFDKYENLDEGESLPFFYWSDQVAMIVFCIEYFSRLICASGTPQHILDRSLPREAVKEDEINETNDNSNNSNNSTYYDKEIEGEYNRVKTIEDDLSTDKMNWSGSEDNNNNELSFSSHSSGDLDVEISDSFPGANTKVDLNIDPFEALEKKEQKIKIIATSSSALRTVRNVCIFDDLYRQSTRNLTNTKVKSNKNKNNENNNNKKSKSIINTKGLNKFEEKCINYCICCSCCLVSSSSITSIELQVNNENDSTQLLSNFNDDNNSINSSNSVVGCSLICCKYCCINLFDFIYKKQLFDSEWRQKFLQESRIRSPLFWSEIYTPTWKMWIFFKQLLNLIDFVAIVPFLLGPAVDSNVGSASVVLRTFRLARVFRVMKLSKHTKAVNLFFKVLRRSSGPLSLLAFFLGMCVMVFGALIYSAERGDWDESTNCYRRKNTITGDMEDSCTPFSSMLMAFYYIFVTITTVGYGDIVPQSAWGRIICTICMLVGVVGFAMPITVISTTFQDEYDLLKRTANKKEYLHHKVNEWDEESVSQWLSNIGNKKLSQYADKFKSEKITGDVLQAIAEKDEYLERLGIITIGHQQLFKQAVENLQKDRDFEPDPLITLEDDILQMQHQLNDTLTRIRRIRKYVKKIQYLEKTNPSTPEFVKNAILNNENNNNENNNKEINELTLNDEFNINNKINDSNTQRMLFQQSQTINRLDWLSQELSTDLNQPSLWEISSWNRNTI